MIKRILALSAGAALAFATVSIVPTVAAAAPAPKPVAAAKPPAPGKLVPLKTTRTKGAVAKVNPRKIKAVSDATAARYKAREKQGAEDKSGQVTTFATSCPTACYSYVERNQSISQPTTATGAQANFTIEKPTVRPWDYHSLAEMAISNTGTGGDNIIEAGWTVDPTLNGDSDPHLFVFHWINGAPQNYNTSFSVVSGATIVPGSNINADVAGGTSKALRWEHFDNATCGCTSGWWLSYKGAFVGVFADTIWSGAFTTPGLIQNFGEVALSQEPSQTNMGRGDIATSAVPTQGSLISSFSILGTGAPAASYTGGVVTKADRWARYDISATSFRYGGPGGNVTVASTTSPSAQDCSGVGVGTDPSGWGAVCFYDGIVSGVPVTKIAQLEGAAGSSCRTNYGTAGAVVSPAGTGTDMIVNTSYKKIDLYTTTNCTGSKLTLGLGRTTLPAPYANAANLSFVVTGSYVTCATGYPTVAPTC